MNAQPEALRLAFELEAPVGTQSTYSAMQQAAAELRRLHAENAQRRSTSSWVLRHYGEFHGDWTLSRDASSAERTKKWHWPGT
jgi:hypothetical protein